MNRLYVQGQPFEIFSLGIFLSLRSTVALIFQNSKNHGAPEQQIDLEEEEEWIDLELKEVKNALRVSN